MLRLHVVIVVYAFSVVQNGVCVCDRIVRTSVFLVLCHGNFSDAFAPKELVVNEFQQVVLRHRVGKTSVSREDLPNSVFREPPWVAVRAVEDIESELRVLSYERLDIG